MARFGSSPRYRRDSAEEDSIGTRLNLFASTNLATSSFVRFCATDSSAPTTWPLWNLQPVTIALVSASVSGPESRTVAVPPLKPAPWLKISHVARRLAPIASGQLIGFLLEVELGAERLLLVQKILIVHLRLAVAETYQFS